MVNNKTQAMYHPHILRNYISGEGSLQMPAWKEWGLAVPIRENTTDEEFEQMVFIQDMVAGILRYSSEKAKAYKEGKLYYYEIVNEIEQHFGIKKLWVA